MRILGLSGSLRRASHNTSLLRAAAMSLPPGVELDLYDELDDLPHYNADIDGEPAPEPVARLREAISVPDGELPVAHAHIAFADDGHLADAGTRGALGELVTLLATRAGAAEVVAT